MTRSVGLAGAARARGRPAAHRRAPPRERRRARDRLCRGGLFARRRRRLRVRHRPAALPLFVDDDAERGLGLRPEDARAHPAQAPGGAERARSGRLRDAPRCRRKAPDGETVPISILHRRDVKPDGTAPLPALRLRRLRHRDAGRRSRPAGCRWSIAASSTRSRMSAAAPRRAGTGTRTASSRRSRTRSPISSRRPNFCASRAMRRRARSSRMAARPAAC